MRAGLRLGVILLCVVSALGQSKVGLEVDEVTDNRMSDTGEEFQLRGSLEVRVKLTGQGLDKALAARVLVTEAKDDQGNSLLAKSKSDTDFTSRDVNGGLLQLSVQQPPRTATSARIKGTIELYVPDRDPAAKVKIDGAFKKLDVPYASKTLKAAKIELTPLSREGYTKLVSARKLTEKDLEQIRAEGKAAGASEKEIEMAIGLAQAMSALQPEPSPNGIAFSGRKSDFDRIYRLEILGSDGEPISITSRSTTSRGEDSIMTLEASSALPENPSLQLMLLTDKTRMSFPFDLKVVLP